MPLNLLVYPLFQHLVLLIQNLVLLQRVAYRWNHVRYTWNLHSNSKNVDIEDVQDYFSLCTHFILARKSCDEHCWIFKNRIITTLSMFTQYFVCVDFLLIYTLKYLIRCWITFFHYCTFCTHARLCSLTRMYSHMHAHVRNHVPTVAHKHTHTHTYIRECTRTACSTT